MLKAVTGIAALLFIVMLGWFLKEGYIGYAGRSHIGMCDTNIQSGCEEVYRNPERYIYNTSDDTVCWKRNVASEYCQQAPQLEASFDKANVASRDEFVIWFAKLEITES